MGPSQMRKQSVKGCALPKCSRHAEFKAANKQKLGRKETVEDWKQVRGRQEPGMLWKQSKESRKGEVKTFPA